MRDQVTNHQGAALLVGAGLLALASGCGQSKISECNALIEVINKGVQSLEKGEKASADPTGVADLKSMADAMDKVAADAAGVKLSIPELQKYSSDYQAMAKEVAKAARDMAAAAEGKDPEKINAAQATMEKAVKQEDPLVDSINKFCQAP
jgi:hypothetical protein